MTNVQNTNQTRLSQFLEDVSEEKLTTSTGSRLTFRAKKLTIPLARTLRMLQDGLSPATIARLENRSKAAISKRMSKLEDLGYLRVGENEEKLTFHAPGSPVNRLHKLGYRHCSIKYQLASDFDLRGEKKQLKNNVEYTKQFVQGFTIEKTSGRRNTTLVITPPWITGDDPVKMQFEQIEKCKLMVNKLNNWYNLRIDPDSWKMCNEGEFDHKYLKHEAEYMYTRVGRVATEQAKLDNSLRDGGELQTFGVDETAKFLATPRRIEALERQILDQKQTIDRLTDSVNELVRLLNRVPEPPENMHR